MPEEPKTDDVEKLLSDEKSLESRKQALIADLLKQRETAMKAYDEKLAKLGYQDNHSGKSKRSHHGKAAPVNAQAKPKTKP